MEIATMNMRTSKSQQSMSLTSRSRIMCMDQDANMIMDITTRHIINMDPTAATTTIIMKAIPTSNLAN